ncbi:diguanylate cyclase (GGDEF domain) with PAS/PAC sensor [Pseudoalteromonas luteoviolacea B = ATCC 29581]|nr:diguanylate cyclase (GGDEF domain) with PAS/PAC sensor [Pseudoalteromonas luteoviolacea B = ATCC 29581]
MLAPSLVYAKETVTLQLKWTHQFQFAGYYMAKEKGFYDEVDIDVNFLPADTSNPDAFFSVLSGRAQFGITHSGILQQRLDGKPLVAMAAILQSSPYCWMVKSDSDIRAPQDFSNKRISHISRSENAELLVMLERAGVKLEALTLYAGLHPLRDFQRGLVDALQVYVTNEPFQMAQQGVNVRLICPKRYDLNVYGDILFTSEQVLQNNPELVERFQQASLKGWRYTLLNLQEALNITQSKYALDKSMEQLAYEAEMLKSYIEVPGVPIGNMTLNKWEWIADLYGEDRAKSQQALKGFLLYARALDKPVWSWMLIAAVLMTVICIPMYVYLIFFRQRKYKLLRRKE